MLHECDRDPFRERAYSIDDITIGLDTTPAAAAACGIRGAMSGGKLTIECWQALPYPSHSPDLVRVTCVYGKLSRFVSGRRRPGPFCRNADFGLKGSEATPALRSCESNQYALAAHLTTTQWLRMCAGARRAE